MNALSAASKANFITTADKAGILAFEILGGMKNLSTAGASSDALVLKGTCTRD